MALLHSLGLLLLLTCLAASTASEREQGRASEETTPSGPSSVEISGPSVITVGIPYAFTCSADCSPSCTFTWTDGDDTASGSEMRVQLTQWVSQTVMICKALNTDTGKSVTVNKTVEVTEGPSDIKITGPGKLSEGVTSTFVCTATCYPSCEYTWRVGTTVPSDVTATGNTTEVTATQYMSSETLVCEAKNSVSHLFISTSLTVYVARGPKDIAITGSDSVTLGKTYQYDCLVDCSPSCNFTWTFNGKTYHGDQVQVPILDKGDSQTTMMTNKLMLEVSSSDDSSTKALTCEAINTISGVSEVATKTLSVTDPISVQSVSGGQPPAGSDFSLKCEGSENPSSIDWLKDGLPVAVSSRVRLSSDNTTLSFSPLAQSDRGLYQCVAVEGGVSIEAIGYNVTLKYGPNDGVITQVDKGPVGKELYVLPGSTTALQCSADCYPDCTYIWIYNGALVGMKASYSLTPAKEIQTPLTCVAYNPSTKNHSDVETMVVLLEGPSNVTISGPDSLEVGVKASFKCLADCSPSPCSYTWAVYGRTMQGSVVSISVNRYVTTESFSCEAHNTVSGETAWANETLSVTEKPNWCGC